MAGSLGKVNLDYFDREAELKKNRCRYKAFVSIGFLSKVF